MRNPTKDEIDRIVEAVKKAAGTVTTFSFGTAIDALYESELITALASVELDQPKIDLKEVEELVKSYCITSAEAESWRKAIGYTIQDL